MPLGSRHLLGGGWAALRVNRFLPLGQKLHHDADLFVAHLAAEQIENGLQTLRAHLAGGLDDALDGRWGNPGRGIGDVLVLEYADPGWTPLFPRAAAVIMEVGGLMCHAAVVARELGIPAVFGVRDATHTLRDGQVVAVDGGSGTISLTPF